MFPSARCPEPKKQKRHPSGAETRTGTEARAGAEARAGRGS